MTALTPELFRPHYSRFLSSSPILLTGHSHQAWPDVAERGLQQAFFDAAEYVDDKWEKAFQKAELLREEIALRIGAHPSEIALGANTHELTLRFLSALDVRKRRHIVTTTGEFHSLYRQLCRMAEEDFEVTFVPAHPVDTLAERMAQQLQSDTLACMVSTVLFETSSVVPNLSAVVEAAHRHGAHVLLDAYHQFSAMPMRVEDFGPDPIFLLGGGYKYAQWGEGCCFLRVPKNSTLRPKVTGWFADFEHLNEPRKQEAVTYARRPADRFAGSTYEPSSHYRAAEVIRLFRDQHWSLPGLRALSLAQTQKILDGLMDYDVRTPQEAALRGGFVSVRIPHAADIVRALREKNVFVDARGDLLRFGPAPYVTMEEIATALQTFRALTGG